MKTVILKVFVDKFTGQQYEIGEIVEFTIDRAAELATLGFVKIAEEAPVAKPKRRATSKK